MTKRRSKTHQRLIALALVCLLVVLGIITLHTPQPKQSPSMALQSAYDRLGLTQPSSYSNNGSISATFTSLSAFSKVHNEVLGQGWNLTSTTFDITGNPNYTYIKTVSETKLELDLSQIISSLNDRKTSVHMLITP